MDIVKVTSPWIDWWNHSVVRAISVVVVLTLLCVIPFFAYQWAYHKGYNAKVCPPQSVYTAPCTQSYVTNAAEKRGFRLCAFPLSVGW